jgi:hypothetical protein
LLNPYLIGNREQGTGNRTRFYGFIFSGKMSN